MGDLNKRPAKIGPVKTEKRISQTVSSVTFSRPGKLSKHPDIYRLQETYFKTVFSYFLKQVHMSRLVNNVLITTNNIVKLQTFQLQCLPSFNLG